MGMRLTNDLDGPIASSNWLVSTSVFTNSWRGFPNTGISGNAPSFIVPLLTNVVLFPDSIYRQFITSPYTHLVPASSNTLSQFEVTSGFPYPYFGLVMTNRLRFLMVDNSGGGVGHILDYVSFNLNNFRDLTREVTPATGNNGRPDFGPGSTFNNNPYNGVWNTNRPAGRPTGPVRGIVNQIGISLGSITVATPNDWNTAILDQLDPSTQLREENDFKGFYLGDPAYTNVTAQTPFNPTHKVVQHTSPGRQTIRSSITRCRTWA